MPLGCYMLPMFSLLSCLQSAKSLSLSLSLVSLHPLLSFFQVISTFIFVGIIFIPIGLASLFASERVMYLESFFWYCLCESLCYLKLIRIIKWNCVLFDLQVVEIAHRYDTDCVPARYHDNMLAYIQSTKTNKTCTRTFLVSPVPCSTNVFQKISAFLSHLFYISIS